MCPRDRFPSDGLPADGYSSPESGPIDGSPKTRRTMQSEFSSRTGRPTTVLTRSRGWRTGARAGASLHGRSGVVSS